jgi:hypothetical protein
MEVAPLNVLQELFPNITVRTCFFHLSQAWYKKLRTTGLDPLYDIDEVRQYLRMMPSCAFLKLADVQRGFKMIKDKLLDLMTNGTIHKDFHARVKGKFFAALSIILTNNDFIQNSWSISTRTTSRLWTNLVKIIHLASRRLYGMSLMRYSLICHAQTTRRNPGTDGLTSSSTPSTSSCPCS